MRSRILALTLLLTPMGAFAEELPLNSVVTQATIDRTICAIGWTKTVRPPRSYTNRIKIKLIRELELPEELLVDFELDHRIPLALGGAPSDPRNLELQPWDEAGEKDAIEACLARAVCAHKITLEEARRRIWRDWREAGKACEVMIVFGSPTSPVPNVQAGDCRRRSHGRRHAGEGAPPDRRLRRTARLELERLIRSRFLIHCGGEATF